MKAKKLLALVLSATMALALLVGCGGGNDGDDKKEPQNQEEQKGGDDVIASITDGYYMYAYNVDTMVMTNYFHFYEEQPVLGKVFYAGYAMNQIFLTGTYDVEKADYEYTCYKDRDAQVAEETTTGTAPYTITFWDFNGNELGKCGFDGDVIYVDVAAEKLQCVSAGNNMYYHDTDGESSKYVETYEAEVGQPYLAYVANDDETCTVALNHDGRYVDMMEMMVEGTWEMKETDDGYEFALTPDSDSDTPAVVKAAKDQMTATYTAEGGEAVELTCTNKELPAVAKFAGEGPEVMEGTKAELTLVLYEGGKAKVTIGIPGTVMDLEEGTWEAAGSDYKVTLPSGEITSAGDTVKYLNEEPSIPLGVMDAELKLQ